MDETEELNEALRGLLRQLQITRASALDARDTMGRLISSSHLSSTLTLLKEDIGLRRLLDLNYKR